MAGKPSHGTTDGSRKPRRAYERLGGTQRQPETPSPAGDHAIQPEFLLENLADGVFVLDKQWRCIYVNRTGTALFRTTPEKLLGASLWETLPHARDSRFQAECARSLEHKTPVEFEDRLDPPGCWFLCRCRPAGEGVAVFLTDISGRKRAEEALVDSEHRLRLVLDGGRMGRWEWDLGTDTMFWCRRVCDLLGLDPSTPARGETFLDRIHPQDRDNVRATMKGIVAEGTVFDAEFRVIRGRGESRGEVVWLTLRGKVIRNGQGQASRMLGVLYDVTDRKQMEAQLVMLNERLEGEVTAQTDEMRTTIDRLQDEVARRVLAEGKLRGRSQMLEAFFQHTITPLAFLDRSFNFIRVNEAYAKADGKTPEYFIGRNHFMLYPDPEMREIFLQVVRTRRSYRAHARSFVYPDGPQRVRYWNWQLTPLLSDSGDVKSLVFSLEDVTSQQMALQELRHRAKQLQKLALELSQAEERERRRLAEILHDDLQQVLAAAKFHLGMLNSRVRDHEELKDLVDQIGSLLREAIGKSRSLSHELSPAVLYQSDLGDTFEWLARQLQAKHGLTVHVEVRGRIEPRSEPLRAFLYKAAQEMLFNVVKHAGVDEARLRLQKVRDRVWLTISDRGHGFDSKALQAAGGFGLMSIRERVEMLGGRVRIRSAAGRGSVFLISVPDQQTPLAAVAVEPAVGGGESGTEVAGDCERDPASRCFRVLLVDDHRVVREGLASLLSSEPDIDIVGQAADGREAIEMAGSLRPDVVVMDVAMPIMNGDEAADQIKRRLPETRVIVLSMSQEPRLAERMRKVGAEAYLLKTSPVEVLLCTIRGLPHKADEVLSDAASAEPSAEEA
ncbi:MAG: PAS domain-containing protein [Phycisphaerales bacterium]